MKILVQIDLPLEPFNTFVREGTAGAKIGRILEETKPEHIFFTESNGSRGAVAVYEMEKSSDLPKFAEPWFLTYNAKCSFKLMMTPQDLGEAGLEDLGKKWG